jgi:hypothetical protein
MAAIAKAWIFQFLIIRIAIWHSTGKKQMKYGVLAPLAGGGTGSNFHAIVTIL